MKTTLLIMAAGIGSRFGTGIKQLEPVDDAGHIIMDYSIHDAIEAGFNHVVFIIRKDIEKEFKEVIGDRIASICSSHNVTVDYAFQDINDIPGTLPEGRTKPWGTGQAVLAAKKVIKTPFIVINADDYYGKEGFKAVHEYLVNGGKSCMAGFVLKNTLSDNGGVTRGICKMDEQNNLTEVIETKNIVKTATGDRIASICSSHNVTVDYAFQDINDIPGTLPEGRTKPWGTGQAVLAAKKVIKTPFIVINADDYYGKEGFKAVHEYLVNGGKSCMAGFVLKNTLSDNGGVTRGICKMDEQNNLTEVIETKNIVKTATGAEADSVVVDVNSLVSMNMWGLTPDFLDVLEEGFKEFFEKEVPSNPLKAEYLIPIFIGELLEQGKMSVKVLKTNDTWYGMTYHEDVAAVKGSFKEMLENGVYKADLFSDL